MCIFKRSPFFTSSIYIGPVIGLNNAGSNEKYGLRFSGMGSIFSDLIIPERESSVCAVKLSPHLTLSNGFFL